MARCTACGCTGSLAGIKARLVRDQTTPLFSGSRCSNRECSCHQYLPTDLNVELTDGN